MHVRTLRTLHLAFKSSQTTVGIDHRHQPKRSQLHMSTVAVLISSSQTSLKAQEMQAVLLQSWCHADPSHMNPRSPAGTLLLSLQSPPAFSCSPEADDGQVPFCRVDAQKVAPVGAEIHPACLLPAAGKGVAQGQRMALRIMGVQPDLLV